MTSTKMGRFRLLNHDELIAPGNCAICGSVSGKFVDFGFDMDFYGVVYFCESNCFREAANAFDFYSPAQWKMASDEINFLRMENNSLKDQIEEMHRVFREFTDNIGTGASVVLLDEKPKSVDQESIPVAATTEKPKSGSTKQTNEQGSSDLQRDDSLKGLLDI